MGERINKKPRRMCPMGVSEAHEQEDKIDALEAEVAQLCGLLETSVTGLEWYMNTYPLDVSECDHEHLAECALALTQEQE